MTAAAVKSLVAEAPIYTRSGLRDPWPEPPPEDDNERASTPYVLLDSAALRAMPPMQWRMKHVLPATGCAAIFGSRGTAKSFLALHIAASIEEGRECFGYRCNPAHVVYVGLEGGAGVPNRVRAWEIANGRDFPCRVVLAKFNLRNRADVLGLATAVVAHGTNSVVMIDTLHRASAGSDENAAKDMGELLAAIEELQRMTGGLVLVVHHAGKNLFAGMRGHSSLDAGLDAIIETKKTSDGGREWVSEKVKEGEDGKAHRFQLLRVQIGIDDDGEPVTSAVVNVDRVDPTLIPAKLDIPTGGNQKIVLDAIRPLFHEAIAFGRAGAPTQRPCIQLEAAIDGAKGHLPVESKRQRERAQAAITGLVGRGVLGSNEGWLWLK